MLSALQGRLLLVATSAGLVLLAVTLITFGKQVDPTELVASGGHARYLHGRSLAAMALRQQEKSEAMSSLEAGLREGKFQDLFKSPEDASSLRYRSWDNKKIIPDQVAFECGGQREAKSCVVNVQSCVDESEATIAKYYKQNPRRAREARPAHVCKCFVSNGCEPACNVAMYMVWASSSGVSCPAHPPSYASSSGVFKYGDPLASDALGSDMSHDYFPEFPSPAGRDFSAYTARQTYHKDPETPQTLPPLHPWHWGQYQYPAAEPYYHRYNYYSPFYGASWRPYSYDYQSHPWFSQYNPSRYGQYANFEAGNQYSDPYWFSGYENHYDNSNDQYYLDTRSDDYYQKKPSSWYKFGNYYYDPVSGQVVM